jgi:hypothetical protein
MERGIDTASKDIATDLAALATMRFIADIYGEGKFNKDNAEG